MKSFFLLIFGSFLLMSCNTQVQDNKPDQGDSQVTTSSNENKLITTFSTDVSNYLDAFNKGDWDTVLDMIYPKLFDYLSREQMVQTFNQISEMGMDIHTEFDKIEKISESATFEDSQFYRVYYRGKITATLSGLLLESKDLLKQSFIEIYGSENVTYNDAQNRFDIDARKSMIAVSKIGTEKWTYIEYEDPSDETLKQLIPKEVLLVLSKTN